MCIKLLTKKDGTLFNVTSILEKDIIKICIQLGHTHPMGVLCYSVTESIMLFQSADKVQLAIHGAIKVTTLHEEAIAIWASPPSATHVRAYLAIRNGEPLGTQHQTPDRERDPPLSPSDCNPGGRPPHHLQANLGDLGDDNLWQLLEDLCQEVALRDLNASPEIHHQPLWKTQGQVSLLMHLIRRLPF